MLPYRAYTSRSPLLILYIRSYMCKFQMTKIKSLIGYFLGRGEGWRCFQLQNLAELMGRLPSHFY